MDNIETTEPIGGEGATSSQDNSAIDTQPVESTDSVSDGNVVETGEALTPWENDPRFKGKSEEERYKSYRELESKLGQREENLDLVKELERTTNMNANQIKEALAQQQYAQYQQTVQENPGLAAFQEVQQLKSQIALQKEEQELNRKRQEVIQRDLDKIKIKLEVE